LNALLLLARLYLPPSAVKKRLSQLFALTADAFGSALPDAVGVSRDEMLERYALYTRDEAGKAIARGEPEKVRAELYRNAFSLGEEIRRAFRIKTRRDALVMGGIMYRALKIDFRGDGSSGIFMKRCFFSSYYSADVCDLISALDEGLIAGLSPGVKLRFFQRITEGDECCRAHLHVEGGEW
jgi:hypothetical protein